MSLAVRMTGTVRQAWAVGGRGQDGPVWTLTSVQTQGSLLGVQSSVGQTLTASTSLNHISVTAVLGMNYGMKP